jgi:hypothetical protein
MRCVVANFSSTFGARPSATAPRKIFAATNADYTVSQTPGQKEAVNAFLPYLAAASSSFARWNRVQ